MKTLSQLELGTRLSRRTLGLVWKSSPVATVVLGVLTIFSAVLPIGIAYVGKCIVDVVVSRSKSVALQWVMIELIMVAIYTLAQRGLALTRQLIGTKLSFDINSMILVKAQTLELRHFEDGRFYDKLTRARREASSKPVSIVMQSFQFIQNVLTLCGYMGLILRFSGWAVLALLITAVPSTVFEMAFSRTVFHIRNWRAPDIRQLNYLEYVLAHDGHAKEVQLLGLSQLFLDRYKNHGEKFYREDRRLAIHRTGWALLLSLVSMIAFYGCYSAVAMAATIGGITIGMMTLYLVAFRQGQQALQSALSAIGSIYEDILYMTNLFEYLDIEVGTNFKSSDIDFHPDRLELGIRFVEVSFQYPSTNEQHADKWALRGISFFVAKGQSLALVGQNGSGKTTLIKLLTRLYEPTEGWILIDGIDIRKWDAKALRARFGVIFQDFNEYQLSIAENIGVGCVANLEEQSQINRAIQASGISQVVENMPGGITTLLGKWAHDGIELSGGQWQKIALARAFMREEADILVLDEPTAALDAEAEYAVFQRVRNLSGDCTTFLISHRLSTVRMANRILLIEGGQIVEDGSHDELIQLGARYAQLFHLQAQGYL